MCPGVQAAPPLDSPGVVVVHPSVAVAEGGPSSCDALPGPPTKGWKEHPWGRLLPGGPSSSSEPSWVWLALSPPKYEVEALLRSKPRNPNQVISVVLHVSKTLGYNNQRRKKEEWSKLMLVIYI